ncbi:hypothetical protein EDC30_102234 [Paucimonas lemoignei]|uniref:Uncharacterized protein n=1 Tax=Paucimonas lemoignei TaxID=29443 RepID=A0A4R3I1L3_PAULE|nr:hypothetical protein [Paucimonas lemoignei]TCS38495.1 hypothetical protein EDC30_102234 [Paucimonas lemoignei]
MRLTCPACGAEFTLDVLIAHEGAREALVEAMGLDMALGKRLVQYLSLFRPAQRQLTMDRVAKILKEISPSIRAQRIERGGRIWSVPRDSWAWALDEIVAKKDRLTLPLKSHGYLLEMLVGAADRAEAATERKVEEQRAQRTFQEGQTIAVRSEAQSVAAYVKQPMPEATREALKQLTSKNRGK